MKILVYSRAFAPSVGGIEAVSEMLAAAFTESGHHVIVVTQTRESDAIRRSYEVVRRPGWRQLMRLTRWCDAVLHNHISLRAAWPLLFVHRPWILAHHIWIPRTIRGRLKRLLCYRARCISVSNAIAAHIDAPSEIVPNPYRDDVFRIMAGLPRDRDIAFVGRLIRDKGAHVAIEALALLRQEGHLLRMTLVGRGPEEWALREHVEAAGLSAQVEFAGQVAGEALAGLLNQHKVLVVPSIWQEPFGLVAIEGMACGCRVVGSDTAGLREAVGDAGLLVQPGDARALAQAIAESLRGEDGGEQMHGRAVRHLTKHQRSVVARRYLDIIADACRAA